MSETELKCCALTVFMTLPSYYVFTSFRIHNNEIYNTSMFIINKYSAVGGEWSIDIS